MPELMPTASGGGSKVEPGTYEVERISKEEANI